MKNLEALQYFTPTGTAEGERHILDQVFVEQEDFDRLVVPKPTSPIVLVGKKGSGKSAILDAIAMTSLVLGVPVARIKPREMKLVGADDDGSVASLTRVAFDALVSTVAVTMASELRGLISVEEKDLLDEGIRTGVLRRDFVSRLAKVLPRLAKPLVGGAPELDDEDQGAALARIREVVRKKLERAPGIFYVLIDDTDQVADSGNPNQINRIWGLILAARDLAQISERLRVVVTIREEVWRRLSRSGAGQRDQADHFDKLTVRLTPSEKLMHQIVEQRLVAAAEYLGNADFESGWPFFFKGKGARIPTSNEFSGWGIWWFRVRAIVPEMQCSFSIVSP